MSSALTTARISEVVVVPLMDTTYDLFPETAVSSITATGPPSSGSRKASPSAGEDGENGRASVIRRLDTGIGAMLRHTVTNTK